MSGAGRVVEFGDSALILRWEADPSTVDEAVNASAVATAHRLLEAGIHGVRDIVPACSSVAVHFDPIEIDLAGLRRVLDREAVRESPDGASPSEVTHVVTVDYGGTNGPDLQSVASMVGLSESEVVRLHSGREYRVYMLGFLPGFGYLGPLDPAIEVARRSEPRPRVPVGSVAIAGPFTGIYPLESPGGWQLIGRTDLRPYDPERAGNFLFKPRDIVRFVPRGVAGPQPRQARDEGAGCS